MEMGLLTAPAAFEPMGVEIRRDIELTDAEQALLDMHSILNLTNVVGAELAFLGDYLGYSDAIAAASREVLVLGRGLSDREKSRAYLNDIRTHTTFFLDRVEQAVQDAGASAYKRPEVRQSVSNLTSIIRVLEKRAPEIVTRLDAPDRWVPFEIDRLRASLVGFLTAIEQNSKGRYRIVYNAAQQGPNDYLVHLSLDSVDEGTLLLPPVFQDVTRDLVANARKYTKPGGCVWAGLVDDGHEIRLVVADTGRGIPEDQVEEVVRFGARARNVQPHETKGGGFGLTKAYSVARRFGGRMWIDSQEGRGTRVTLVIPRPFV